MWVLKLNLKCEGQFMGTLAKKHSVSLSGYPLSFQRKKSCLHLLSFGIIFGDDNHKKAFLEDIGSRKECVSLEHNNDFFVSITKQPLFTQPLYHPLIFRPSPVIIHKDGFHIWELASFERKLLENVIQFAKKKIGARIVSFKNKNIKQISFTSFPNELTSQQKKAMELAIHQGYYEFPKKVTMESLAKEMKVSYSTYQAHLKKAESRIIPSIYRQL